MGERFEKVNVEKSFKRRRGRTVEWERRDLNRSVTKLRESYEELEKKDGERGL